LFDVWIRRVWQLNAARNCTRQMHEDGVDKVRGFLATWRCLRGATRHSQTLELAAREVAMPVRYLLFR